MLELGMLFLIIFAFIGGVVTVLSPCILPLLPIILSSTYGGKAKPYGIIAGFVASFTFFTLFLSEIIQATGLGADSLRRVSIFIIAFMGISLIIPQTQIVLERLFSFFSRFVPSGQNKTGFFGGLVIGLTIGLLWTPCVGPILASVITLAVTGNVNAQAVIITLAYSLGTAIPMFLILKSGNQALKNVPWLVQNSANIQKIFGILTILTAIAIYLNIDKKFQSLVLNTFPNYAKKLTAIEDNVFVNQGLPSIGIEIKETQRPQEQIAQDTQPKQLPYNALLGYLGIEGLATNEAITPDEFATYTPREAIAMEYPALEGEWKISPEFSEPKEGASLLYGFTAMKVRALMKSSEDSRIKIYVNGEELDTITISEEGIYDLVSFETAEPRLIWIEFLDEGVQVYALRFE